MEVHHNTAAHRFEARCGDSLAICEYSADGSEMVITHTFVPPEARGSGIAARLVDAAAAHATGAGLRLVPACSYAAAHLRRRG